MLTIAVTGHRPDKLYGYDFSHPMYILLRSRILVKLKKIIDEKYDDSVLLVQGMAQGIDQMIAKIGFRLRLKYPVGFFKVEAAIPCTNQPCKWPKASQEEWRAIKDQCDIITYVSNSIYTSWCMQKRNMYMVDKCDILLAIWDGTPGGTANCVKYAKKQGKKIIRMIP